MTLRLRGVDGLAEVRPGDDLGALVATHAAPLRAGDVVIVAQKVVSKAEGRLQDLNEVIVSARAREIAQRVNTDPRMVQVVLDESVAVLRDERVLIVETRHGFVCANAGVDRSNIPGEDTVCLLPLDCDASADALRARIREVSGIDAGVVISDTFGRAWRDGLCNVALGVSGVPSLIDYRGEADDCGRPMTATVVALADELAAAAEIVMGKTRRVPAVVVTGLDLNGHVAGGRGRDLVRPRGLDLFR